MTTKRKKTAAFRDTVQKIADDVLNDKITDEQGMDRLQALAKIDPTAENFFEVMEAAGHETTAERKADGSDPIGQYSGDDPRQQGLSAQGDDIAEDVLGD